MLPTRISKADESAHPPRSCPRAKSRYVVTYFVLVLLAAAHSIWTLRELSASISSSISMVSTQPFDASGDTLKNLADENEWRVASGLPEPSSAATSLLIHYTAKSRELIVERMWAKSGGPNFDIRFYNDEDSLKLVTEYRSHFVETYTTQLSPVERADYFRYLVLWAFGGVYLDSDIIIVKPFNEWLAAFGWDTDHQGWKRLSSLALVAGVEFPMEQSHYNETGWLPLQLTQFAIAGAKGSSVLEHIIDHIERCVVTVGRRGDVEKTLQRTGPAAFTRAIVDEIQTRGLVSSDLLKLRAERSVDSRYPPALLPCDDLEKNGQLIPLRRPNASDFDHVLVLPYRAFAFHRLHSWAERAVLTVHRFQNSWRQNPAD